MSSGPQSAPPAAAAPAPAAVGPTAAHVMHRRPPTADQHTSVWSAWQRLRGREHRQVVVIDARARPVGVLDERDLSLAWPAGPLGAQQIPLRRLLVGRTPPQVRAGDDLATVAGTMLAANTDAVAVVDDDGRLVGLVTARLCVQLLANRVCTHA